ncbi:MAG: hypothetical protein AAF399_23700 [Bacteroidota bacterium]
MKNHPYLFLLLLGCLACQEGISPQCEPFETAVRNWDEETVNLMVDELAEDLAPDASSNDKIGHANNLDILIRRLKAQCDQVKVRKVCYACIYTLPAQSEIKFSLDSAGVEVHRIIDIRTPDDEPMTGIGMHGA